MSVREQWWVDGYELTDGTNWDLEYRTGLYGSPSPVGDNAPVPGVTGTLWRPKRHGPGRFVLAMWLGADGGRQNVEQAWDNMLRALCRPHALLNFQRLLASGQTRQCQGEVVSDLNPDPIGQQAMRYSVEVLVPAGYWEAITDSAAASTAGATLPKTITLDEFADATAPMETLVYTISGPIDNPQLVDVTDAVDGYSWTYTGHLPDGQQIIVDAGEWTVTGAGGFTVDHSAYSYTDTRFMTVVAAKPGGIPTVELRGANGGTNTALSISGRARYLV